MSSYTNNDIINIINEIIELEEPDDVVSYIEKIIYIDIDKKINKKKCDELYDKIFNFIKINYRYIEIFLSELEKSIKNTEVYKNLYKNCDETKKNYINVYKELNYNEGRNQKINTLNITILILLDIKLLYDKIEDYNNIINEINEIEHDNIIKLQNEKNIGKFILLIDTYKQDLTKYKQDLTKSKQDLTKSKMRRYDIMTQQAILNSLEKPSVKPSVKPIKNYGNYCFFNASIQFIFNSELLCTVLSNIIELKQDIELYRSTNTPIDLNQLNLLNNKNFGLKTLLKYNNTQEDAYEYLALLFNKINPNDNLNLNKIMSTCHPIINNYILTPELDIDIYLINLINLSLINIVQNTNNMCNFQDIIIIRLNIFTSEHVKLLNVIEIPFKWNVLTNKPNKSNTTNYNLTGVIAHMGSSTKNGHYVAYLRKMSNDKDIWYLANDSTVHQVKPTNETCKFIYDQGFTPYLLMFEKSK